MLTLRACMRAFFALAVLAQVADSLHVPSVASQPALAHPSVRAHKSAESPLRRTVQESGGLRLRGGGTGAIIGLMFSLFKAIVGSGILSLSSGIAAYTNDPKFILPASAISVVFGILSAYCYELLGTVSEMTGGTNYKECWMNSVERSLPGTAWMPALACTLQTAVACTCYSIIIGDLGHSLTERFKVKGFFQSRENLLVTVSASLLVPLCLLRDVSQLAYSSMLGVAGVLYVAFFMTLRYFQGDYAKAGQFIKQAPKAPVFGSKFEPIKMLILMASLNTAYHAHYNAPDFYQKVPAEGRSSKFSVLVYTSFMAAAVICTLIMVIGFMTFGGNADSLILNSYATQDMLAVFGRLGCGASILFSYPLVFNGFRGNAFSLLGFEGEQWHKDAFAIGTVAATTGIAMVMRDLGFMVAFAGALLGSSIIYVFPALMHVFASADKAKEDNSPKKFDYYVSWGIAGAGVCFGILGAVVSYLKSFTDVLG